MSHLAQHPSTIKAAKRFVGEHHRHNEPPTGALFATAAAVDDEIVGVVIVGRPSASALDDGFTVEVIRCCTDGYKNACSFLYGAATRGAQDLGWRRAYTYTADDDKETGASLKASGWIIDEHLPARPTWDGGNRYRVQVNLFGEERRPPGPKIRWVKQLHPRGVKQPDCADVRGVA